MENVLRVEAFIKQLFEKYSLNYLEFLHCFDENGNIIPLPLVVDGELNMLVVKKAAKVLGVSVDDLIEMNEKAAFKWYNQYSFFVDFPDYLLACNSAYRNRSDKKSNLLAAIFQDASLLPARFKSKKILPRLLALLKELDQSLPGTFHKDASIKKMEISTSAFCHYLGIRDLVQSFLDMAERAKTLFFKAIYENLRENEIKEYNFLVSVLGLCDMDIPAPRGYLYHNKLLCIRELIKEDGCTDFFSYVKLFYERCFAPWQCAEFLEDKQLVQSYADLFPDAKKRMREFAMEATRFKCIFTWSDAKPIVLPDEDELLITMFGDEPIPLAERAKEKTTVYVPKTDAELNGDEEYAQLIMALTRSENLGGISVRVSAFLLNDLERMMRKVTLLRGACDE